MSRWQAKICVVQNCVAWTWAMVKHCLSKLSINFEIQVSDSWLLA